MSEGGEVVIKKVKKGGHGGHHGGAWKVAYADFVTAMMAFFLLLWLLNSVTRNNWKVSPIISRPSPLPNPHRAGDILGGKTIAEEGASTRHLPPFRDHGPASPKAGSGGSGEAGSTPERASGNVADEQQEEKSSKTPLERSKYPGDPNLVEVADNIQVDVTPEGTVFKSSTRTARKCLSPGGSRPTTKLREPYLSPGVGIVSTSKSGAYGRLERSNSAEAAIENSQTAPTPPSSIGRGCGTRVDEVVGRAAREPLFRDDQQRPKSPYFDHAFEGTGDKDDSTLTKSEDGVIGTLPVYSVFARNKSGGHRRGRRGQPRIVGRGSANNGDPRDGRKENNPDPPPLMWLLFATIAIIGLRLGFIPGNAKSVLKIGGITEVQAGTRHVFLRPLPPPCPPRGTRGARDRPELVGRDAVQLHDALSLAGYRRSHGIAYAPACPDCNACTAVRILAQDFIRSRNHKRLWKTNKDLTAAYRAPKATEEQFDLFCRYLNARHADGDMSRMDFLDYRTLVEDTPVDTVVAEFRDPAKRLVAACLVDRVRAGLSAVYALRSALVASRFIPILVD